MDDLTIREAEYADLPAILKIYEKEGMFATGVSSLEEARAKLQRMKSYSDYTIYVAEKNGLVIAVFELLVMENLGYRNKKSGVFEDVVVAEEYRNQGIGSHLVKFALETCKQKGCYKMALSSHKSFTRAHGFYEKLGLEKHGYSFVASF